MAFTATTSSGGESRASARASTFVEAGQSFLEETLAPLGNDLERHIKALRDCLILHPLGSEKHDFGSDHLSLR
jgi:hypothetical protein